VQTVSNSFAPEYGWTAGDVQCHLQLRHQLFTRTLQWLKRSQTATAYPLLSTSVPLNPISTHRLLCERRRSSYQEQALFSSAPTSTHARRTRTSHYYTGKRSSNRPARIATRRRTRATAWHLRRCPARLEHQQPKITVRPLQLLQKTRSRSTLRSGH